MTEALPGRRHHEDRSPFHVGERIDDEARQAHVCCHAQLLGEGLEGEPLRAFSQDQQARFALCAHPSKGSQQGGEVLLRDEPACTEHDRRLAPLEPRVLQWSARALADLALVYRVVNDGNALGPHPDLANEVVGDPL